MWRETATMVRHWRHTSGYVIGYDDAEQAYTIRKPDGGLLHDESGWFCRFKTPKQAMKHVDAVTAAHAQCS